MIYITKETRARVVLFIPNCTGLLQVNQYLLLGSRLDIHHSPYSSSETHQIDFSSTMFMILGIYVVATSAYRPITRL